LKPPRRRETAAMAIYFPAMARLTGRDIDCKMSAKSNSIYLGTDSGATTSKVGGVWEDGQAISTKLLQRPTNAQQGTDAVVRGWVEAITDFLAQNDLTWAQVKGVGLAIPGPFQRYGVLGRSANLPASFDGWNVQVAYGNALAEKAGRPLPLIVDNDGKFGGVAEAKYARGNGGGSVLLLAPGSGLGSAYIDRNGLPLDGDSLAGMETAHMPAPLHLLNMKPFACGCGKNWGCIEAYTTISGLPQLLTEMLPNFPGHDLANSTATPKERALSLRGLAQKGDALAVAIFDFQARAMGLHVANLAMALDPQFVVIGGGLMDPEATTPEFRHRYLGLIRETAAPYLWPSQRARISIVPAALGDLSQAIGAALAALYQRRD
jgi:predicted NBD/HSP70 family sugar kinase